jgi:hypothetical protein
MEFIGGLDMVQELKRETLVGQSKARNQPTNMIS